MSRWAPPGRASIIFRVVPQPRRTPPKSKYTSDRLIPGAFEGETVTRRRLMGLTVQGAGAVAVMGFTLPALGFAIGTAVFERPPVDVGGRRSDRRLPGRHLRPEGDHERPGHRRGRQDHRLHPRLQPGDRRRAGHQTSRAAATSSRSRPAACTSAARSASWRRPSASSARATAASTTSPARSTAARPSGRWTASTRACKADQVEIGPRFSVNSEFERFPSYRDPGQDLDGIGQYLYPGRFSTPKLD